MKVTLLTGGDASTHYVLALLSGLVSAGIKVDLIGSDATKDTQIIKNKNVVFYNLRGDQNPDAPIKEKIARVLKYYFKLVKYAYEAESKLFHIQWLNKFVHFDRTFLNIYYKLLGKKLVFTAHNVNAAERDQNDSLMNRLTLKLMYKIVDHIIVHTNKMKLQLIDSFNIKESKVTVIPHGILNIASETELTRMQARKKLHLKSYEKVLLFFGIITPYKGLEYLLMALDKTKEKYDNLRLVIAGKVDKNSQAYYGKINRIIKDYDLNNYVIKRIEFIPDEDIEVYFKSADVLILPYNYIFQSGLIFLAFNFGLPVIATDVGSLRESIIEGRTGFICKPRDPYDLAKKINRYYDSNLFKN